MVRVGHGKRNVPFWGRKNERYSNWPRDHAIRRCCRHATRRGQCSMRPRLGQPLARGGRKCDRRPRAPMSVAGRWGTPSYCAASSLRWAWPRLVQAVRLCGRSVSHSSNG
ncbi:hypothetical protein DF052_00695 [Burkholderia glumae]|nr:hypothetical protein DF052_00695 [Burkholderia glumae]